MNQSDAATRRALKKLARNRAGLPVEAIGTDCAAQLCRNDLAKRDGRVISISDAGRKWLRRAMSGADPWLAQHRDLGKAIVAVDGVRREVRVDLNESPLSWLRKRKGRTGRPLIDDAQFTAGERLRADFTRAQMTPRVTADWSSMDKPGRRRSGLRGGHAEMLDSAVAARTRFNNAITDVGPELSPALIDVCCFLEGLEAAEKKNNWPKRSGKLVLQLALSALARHYGLVQCNTRSASSFMTTS